MYICTSLMRYASYPLSNPNASTMYVCCMCVCVHVPKPKTNWEFSQRTKTRPRYHKTMARGQAFSLPPFAVSITSL